MDDAIDDVSRYHEEQARISRDSWYESEDLDLLLSGDELLDDDILMGEFDAVERQISMKAATSSARGRGARTARQSPGSARRDKDKVATKGKDAGKSRPSSCRRVGADVRKDKAAASGKDAGKSRPSSGRGAADATSSIACGIAANPIGHLGAGNLPKSIGRASCSARSERACGPAVRREEARSRIWQPALSAERAGSGHRTSLQEALLAQKSVVTPSSEGVRRPANARNTVDGACGQKLRLTRAGILSLVNGTSGVT